LTITSNALQSASPASSNRIKHFRRVFTRYELAAATWCSRPLPLRLGHS
jgi:hypothetical protein